MKKAVLWMLLLGMLVSAFLGGCANGQVSDEPVVPNQSQQEEQEEGPWITEEEWDNLQQYGEFDLEFAFYMPGAYGFENQGWTVGLGTAHEFGLGLPYNFLGHDRKAAEDLVAYNWGTVETAYYEGLHVIYFNDLKTKAVMLGEEPTPSFVQYMSTTQPDCKTFRGIHVGNTIDELMEAYPEVQGHLDYVNHAKEAEAEGEITGVADHDAVWMYLPEYEPGTNPNRSILFLTKDGVIVQIDMADGLDGQIWSPVFTGAPIMIN